MSELPQERLRVGQLRAAYGIQGWVWIYSETDPVENVFDYQPWWIQTATGWSTLKVKRWRTQGKGLVVRFADVEDRNAAEQLFGTVLWIDKAQLPKAGEDEYYWSDLVGLSVYGLAQGQSTAPLLGVVSELFETGANDVMVVKPCHGSVDDQERFIPWHRDVLTSVDLGARRIDVNWGVDY